MAIIVNLVGVLYMNASLAFVSANTVPIIKWSEPIFFFLLLFIFDYKLKPNWQNIPIVLSLVVISLGVCFVVSFEITFNIWEILTTVLSSIALPLRNIMLKNLGEELDDPLKQCSILSIFGLFYMVPILCLKGMVKPDVAIFQSKWSIESALSHFIHNIASITVLQSTSPLYHAILNFTRKTIVIIANIASKKMVMTWQISFGLGMVITGLALFYYFRSKDRLNYNSYRKSISNIIGLVSFIGVVVAGTMIVRVHMNTNRSFLDGKLISTKLTKLTKMATSWVYERPIPINVVENIKTLHHQTSGIPIHVYCGTSQCVTSIQSLNNPNITANLVVIPELVRNTTLETWFMRHPLNKILAGIHFEDHLQEAVRLAHLWHHGGIFIDPTVKLKNKVVFFSKEEAWITMSGNSTVFPPPSFFDISKFPPRHPFVKELSGVFVSEYQTRASENPANVFRKQVWNIYRSFSETSRTYLPLVPLGYTKLVVDDTSNKKNRFGTLSYDSRVIKVNATNLDDEIQGFPGIQFLPYVDIFVDIELQNVANREDNLTIFFNGWWSDRALTWPLPQNFHPVMLSIHLDKAIKPLLAKNVTLLKRLAPIGCKDVSTLNFLRNLGVDSFLSGCLTLLLKQPNVSKMRSRKIYLVDVNQQFREILPPEIRRGAIPLRHRMTKASRFQSKARFIEAYELIEKYSHAKLVITQTIHCALPCVAMGIPVIFINSSSRPAHGIGKLTKLFHTLDVHNMSMNDASTWMRHFNWSDPPNNPNLGVLMSMRTTLWKVIRENRVFYESARRFGLIPLLPPKSAGRSQQLFHLVFTTSKNTLVPAYKKKLTGEFNWRHWRCVESIFYHHPFAKVIIHSNTLNQSTFDVLTEVGYDLQVIKYNLTTLAENTPAEIFVKHKMKTVSDGIHWYSHETDLLRLLLLYKFGGVYLDTDVIVVRSLDNLVANVLGWESKNLANGAIMKFEKGHPFLEACLSRFAKQYNKNAWAAN